jgi:hypothetical protein
MRGLDCQHPAHDDVHFDAEDDSDLERQVRQHIEDAHPDMSPDDARGIVAQGAYEQ